MSFKTNINYKGLTIENAFFTVHAVGGTKERKVIELHCYAYEELYNQDQANNTNQNILFIDNENEFVPDVSDTAVNDEKQAYQYLRTDKYTDAVDC